MFDVICVTSRKCCEKPEDFFAQLEKIARSDVKMIILREKDLSEAEYFSLAERANEICKIYGKTLVIHKYTEVAEKLGIRHIHLPFSQFCNAGNFHERFDVTGTSVHSTEEAIFAQRHGADYITAGHIFSTDCKKGLAPRGIEFLKAVCDSTTIPVYVIGGIDENSVAEIEMSGQKSFSGVCVMSGLMKSENPSELVKKIMKNSKTNLKANKKIYSLYAVTDRHWLCGRELKTDVEKALRGGATLVQLREKDMNFEVFCNEAQVILQLCRSYGVPLIINDNVRVAAQIKADGVHLGQDDMSPAEARKILGDDKIIGVTARTVEQAVKAESDGADYIGSGAVFGMQTKGDAVKMSIETLNSICGAVNIPVVAIGGITKNNAKLLMGTKISGIASVSGIFAERDIENSAKELKSIAEDIINGKQTQT